MPENEKSLRTIFIEAVEMTDEEERAAYLERVCGDDDNLRQRLERLLKSHADAEGGASEAGATNVRPPLNEKPGDRIGRYVLREQIGEGGCGVVYVAEQEEPIRRRVALKVIKLGMDTKSVIARFEAERQALAMMDHANIARVLDAGATDTGRPYFVMELVRGIKITDYCDQNNLSTQQRLDLFNQVCRAIQHAHQKGIIHRDIKPSNILVTLHDGVPVPKVIDFGIAKATEGRLTDLTVYTELHQFIGTPAYMSPEQAEMSGLDVDTRSDIYSLGVLLYELLTGKTPFDARELLQAGLDQMRRIIREQEPVKPSTRLSTLTHADLSEVARHRQVEAPKLIHVVRGDLDWIIMKALEKDRTRRYETASGLAMDIERHLNNEPVVARPPGNLYRFRKLVRRNKLAFAAAGAVLVALALGLGVSTWSFFEERAARQRAVAAELEQTRLREEAQQAQATEARLRQEAESARQQAQAGESKAQTEAAKSRQVAQFLQDMLRGVNPWVAGGRDTALLRDILDKSAERLGKDLADQPEVRAKLCAVIGDVYVSLGESAKAEAMFREALALRRKLPGNVHPDVASSLTSLCYSLRRQRKLEEAEQAAREALTIRRTLHGNEHPEVAGVLLELSTVFQLEGKWDDAETAAREALAIMRKAQDVPERSVAAPRLRLGDIDARHDQDVPERSVAEPLRRLAQALDHQGRRAEAQDAIREALALYRKSNNAPENFVYPLEDAARIMLGAGNWAEAEGFYRECLPLKRKLFGNEHFEVFRVLHHLAEVIEKQDRPMEAKTFYLEALEIGLKLPTSAERNKNLEIEVRHLMNILSAEGQALEDEQVFRQILASNDPPQRWTVPLRQARIDLFARRGSWNEAAAELAKALEAQPTDAALALQLASLLTESGESRTYLQHCHDLLKRVENTDDATTARRVSKASLLSPLPEADTRIAVALAEIGLAKSTEDKFIVQAHLGKGLAEYRLGHLEGAIEWMEKVLSSPQDRSRPVAAHIDVAAHSVLALAHYRLGHARPAAESLTTATALMKGRWLDADQGDLGPNWVDAVVAHVLLREAGNVDAQIPPAP